MKKRIRKTGEIVDVIAYASPLGAIRCQDDNVSYIDSKGVEHDREEGLNYHWDFEDAKEQLATGIDWEQRRYEIAKTVLSHFRDGSNVWLSAEETAKCVVHYADALIAKLREGGNQ